MSDSLPFGTSSDYFGKLPEITKSIVESYDASCTTSRLDRIPMPNKDSITAVLSAVGELLFPGYRRHAQLRRSNINCYVGNLVEEIFETLNAQVMRAFCCEIDSPAPWELEKIRRCGEEIAFEFLQRIPELRAKLILDAEAAIKGDPACKSTDEVVFCYPGFDAILVYRVARVLHEFGVPLIPRIMTEIAHSRTGIDIHPGAKIGDHFFIDHGTGVVVGETCVIGNWVKLYQGVTLGALSFPRDEKGKFVTNRQRHPTLEDNVVVYANATILGGDVVIGEGAVIGSSAWITESVKPHSTVVIENPKLVTKTHSSRR